LLISLLGHNASNDGRVLLSVKVDGHELLGAKTELKWDDITSVEVKSGTQKELYLSAIDITVGQLAATDATIDPILEALLCDSWENAFAKLNGFLQSMRRILSCWLIFRATAKTIKWLGLPKWPRQFKSWRCRLAGFGNV